MQQSSLGPILPLHNVSDPMHKPSCQKSQKNIYNIYIITQKVLVTQSSNMMHCNQHTKKPLCTDLQAFLNTFTHSN